MPGPGADRVLEAGLTLVGADPPELRRGVRVALRGGRVAGVHDAADPPPAGSVERHPGCVLMPGLVNAHQHGRGISQRLLGLSDDALEPWIARRMGLPAPDVGVTTRLAARRMLGCGVTACVHANYSHGGDYEAEVRAALAAYDGAGMRVTFCVGAQDRGHVLYPPEPEAPFLAALPPDARALAAGRAPAYAGDAAGTLALMDRLRADWAGHPRITLAYGPSNPLWVSDALMTALARDGERRGIGLHMHAAESPAQAAACAAMFPQGLAEHLRGLGALHPMTTLGHGTHLTARDIDVLAKAGARVAHNPGSNLRLRGGIAPVAALRAAGVEVGMGTDDTALADDADLLAECRLAAGLAQRDGGVLPAADRLAMLTAQGARAAFLSDAGALRVGAVADLALFDAARLGGAAHATPDRLPDMLRGRDLRRTIVDGRTVFDADAEDMPDDIDVDVAADLSRRVDPRRFAAADALAKALSRRYAVCRGERRARLRDGGQDQSAT